MGLRSATQKTTKRREADVKLPVSEEIVHLVGMLRREHREYTQFLRDDDEQKAKLKERYANELLCNRCAVDALGKPEFTDDEIMNGALDGMDSADFTELFAAVIALMSADKDAIEEAIKNSKRTDTNASSGVSCGPTESQLTKSTSDLMTSI